VAGDGLISGPVAIGNTVVSWAPYAVYVNHDFRGLGGSGERGIFVDISSEAADARGIFVSPKGYYTGSAACTLHGLLFNPMWYGTATGTIEIVGVKGSVYLRAGSSKATTVYAISSGFYVEAGAGSATFAACLGLGIGNNVSINFTEYCLIYSPDQGSIAATQWAIRILDDSPSTIAGRLSVGHSVTPAASLHVEQAGSTAAIPVLTMKQADIDQVLVKVIATAEAASPDRTLAAAADFGTPGALVAWIQVEIDDLGNRITDGHYYIPVHAAPS
jgi:hypothetical protein